MWRRKRVEPSVKTFVIFLLGCIALFVVSTYLAVLDRNGARPFAVIAVVLSAGFAVATVVAIVILRRGERGR